MFLLSFSYKLIILIQENIFYQYLSTLTRFITLPLRIAEYDLKLKYIIFLI